MSRPLLLRRLTAVINARIDRNAKLLCSAAVQEASPESQDGVHMTENCVRRLKELHGTESSTKEKMLRLSVEAGGCSGFQYTFSLDAEKNADDRIFENNGGKLVVDSISFDFVKGSSVDYVEELISSKFQVVSNPNAAMGCSCKSSFTVK